MPLIGQIDFKEPIFSLGKLPKLERFYWHAYVLFSPNIRFISPKNERFPRIPRLKVFDYKIAAKNSWYFFVKSDPPTFTSRKDIFGRKPFRILAMVLEDNWASC